MEIVSSLRQNGLRGVHQWKKEMLQAIQDTNDTIEQMDASAIRMFTSGIKHFVPACAAMVDDFQEGVLSELQRAKTHVQNMNYKDLARLGTNLTGIVVGGVFGIVIVGGANAAAVGGMIGGCVLFGACKVGIKWTGYSLNTKASMIAAYGISVLVCLGLGAVISLPALAAAAAGVALTGGAAVTGYLAHTYDERAEMRQRIHQLENEREEMRNEREEMRNEREEMRNEREEMRNEREEMRVRMARIERFMQNSSGGS